MKTVEFKWEPCEGGYDAYENGKINKEADGVYVLASEAHKRERVLMAKHEDDLLDAEAKREKLFQSKKLLIKALKKIAHSGPVDQSGHHDPYDAWSWCYDIARAALAAKDG